MKNKTTFIEELKKSNLSLQSTSNEDCIDIIQVPSPKSVTVFNINISNANQLDNQYNSIITSYSSFSENIIYTS